MNRIARFTFSTFIATALLGGCSSATKVQPRSANTVNAAAGAAPTPQSRDQDTNASRVHVDDAIAKACALPTPEFAFDSSRLDGPDTASLDAIARCFSTGPLAGKGVRLVGHADPRGEAEYNFGLGQRRAGSVASFVEHHGVASRQVATTSRGALDATGTDEAGWARDRRVDVTLSN